MSDFEAIKSIEDFKSMVKYLRTELGWPIEEGNAENLTFEYTPEELGLDEKAAVKIEEIKQIKPLVYGQPWGIFWIEFESKRLPVTVMRRILAALVKKKRGSSKSDQATWEIQDLMFISATGEGNERGISFAHFNQSNENLPQLRTFYWDANERHFYYIKNLNLAALHWPSDVADKEAWKEQWAGAFTSKHRGVITKSHDLAVRMAYLASSTRDLVIEVYENEVEKGPLHKLFNSFKELLIHDLEVNDFADMYAQTITYGLFSAAAARSEEDFNLDYAVDLIPNTNPFLRDLLEECLRVGSMGHLDIEIDELGVGELVTVLGNTDMEAVIQDFGRLTGGEDPVIHFYETFLNEYDAEKKVQRGVFFTPWPVVSYIVRSVDELLRTEFGLEDGLADTTTWGEMAENHEGLEIPEGVSKDQVFVQILDPATGTGTFLVEAIDLIHKTMVEKWKTEEHDENRINALWNDYVPEHLLPRLHGYELLMAPYAIAHLKIGLKLNETGYRFGSEERARVYLTNSLEPASDVAQMELKGILPALAHEAQAVNEIKRKQRFTVVIGNPPYSVKSYNNGPWIRGLLEDFKKDLNETKLNLDDDYIKFLRLLTHLAEVCGVGVYSMITNNSFLTSVTHRRIRWYLLDTFDRIQVTDLHGDSRYGEVPPEEWKNENVFDIQQGVCISCFKKLSSCGAPSLTYADVWGSRDQKYSQLLSDGDIEHKRIDTQSPLWVFKLTQKDENDAYDTWPLITDWMPISSNGIETHRDAVTLHFTSTELSEIIDTLLSFPVERTRALLSVGDDGRDWKLEAAVASLRTLVNQRKTATLIAYRPLDFRYTMLNAESGGFIAYPRWKVMSHLVQIEGNVGLVSARLMARGGQWDSCLATRHPPEKKAGDSTRSSTVFPLLIGLDDALQLEGEARPNLSAHIVEELRQACSLGIPDDELGEAYDIFSYLFALLHSPVYRERYIEDLRTNFPRLPVPGSLDLFRDLARPGSELVALHLMESPKLEDLITTYTGPKNPEVGKVGWSDGTVWLDTKKNKPRSMHRAKKPGTLGFHGVPEAVWDFHIGGYQVCHKWLKARKGRTLTKDDINHYQKIVVALSETIRIMGEIDEVIEAHGGWPDAFAVGEQVEAISDEKVIPFPLPDEADEVEQRPMRKAAEETEEYKTDD